MKKQIIALISIIFLLAVVLFLILEKDSFESNAKIAQQAFLEEGSITCTFEETYEEMNNMSNIIFHIKNGNVRLNYQDNEGEGNLLLKNEIAYIWSDSVFEFEFDGERKGIKIPTDDFYDEDDDFFFYSLFIEKGKNINNEEFKERFKEFNFSCEEGAPDEMFELPIDIEFEGF